jgi:hypothetical protein
MLWGGGWATRKTSDIWTRLQQANAAAERVLAVLEQPIEIRAQCPGLPPVPGHGVQG